MHTKQYSHAPRRKEICIAILSGFSLFGGINTPAVAQLATEAQATPPRTYAFELPAAPLADTLEAISRLSGQAIQFDRVAAAGRHAPSIKGSMTARQATDAALAGSGWEVIAGTSGALTVGAVQSLQKVEIIAKRNQAEFGFKADRSDTATRSGTDLMDVPGSVTIITSKVLESQQAISVRDSLANVSGIGFTESPQGVPQFSVRGFSQSSLTTNGVPDQNAAQANVFAVERIEVLKGPQAILAGANSLGGGVNVVTKKPSADAVRDLTLQYGTNDDATIAGDLAGAFSDDKRLSYRVIASATRAGKTDMGYDGRREDSLLPQLRWKDASTDMTVGFSYVKQHLPLPEYTFARRDGLIMPTPQMMLSHEKDGFGVRERRAFYQLEQKITPSITLVSRLQSTRDQLDLHQYSPVGLRYNTGAANNDTNGTSRFVPSYSATDQTQTSGDHYLRTNFNTGDFEHKLSVGAGHSNFKYQQTGFTGGSTQTVTLYPNAVAVAFPEVHAVNTNVDSVTDVIQSQKGVFVQDLVSYGDWNLLFNLRRTLYTQSGRTDFRSANFVFESPEATIGSTTPGAGVVYRLTPSTSLYASYSEGFVPQTAAACGGGIVPPMESQNKELGAKFLLFDDKLSLTTSAFEIAQSNSAVFDSVNRCYNVQPALTARGLELDIQGELANGWSALFNYSYTTLKDVSDPTRLFPGKPRHKASLWTTYLLPFEAVKGLGVGLGVNATSKMEGTFDTRFPFQVRGQAQVNASVFYDQPKWNLTLGVKNIADRRLYGISTSNSYVPVRPGRTFMLTLKRSFN